MFVSYKLYVCSRLDQLKNLKETYLRLKVPMTKFLLDIWTYIRVVIVIMRKLILILKDKFHFMHLQRQEIIL